MVVLGVQLVGAAVAFGLALRKQQPPPLDPDERRVREVEPELVGASRV